MDFKPVSVNSITVNPPMKSISSPVGFAALSKACSFAEEILSKYGKTEDGYFSADTLVFLNRLRDSLQSEKTRREQMMIALKLMISHRLIVLGKVAVPGSGRLVREAYERRISQLMLTLKNTDCLRWEQLSHIREVLENDDRLLSVIRTTERELDTHKEITTYADIGELMRLVQPSASFEELAGVYSARLDFPAFSELALISSEKAEPSAVQLNITDSKAFYSDAGDLIFRSEQSSAAANDSEAAANSDTASPSADAAIQTGETTPSVNAADSTERTKEASSADSAAKRLSSEKTAADKQRAETVYTDRPSAADELVLNEDHRQYPAGDSLIFKNEISGIDVEQTETVDITNTSVASQTAAEYSNTLVQNSENSSQTVISVEPTDPEKAAEPPAFREASENVLQIRTEEAQYQSGDSLIFKNETNETNVGQTALTDITNISNATQTASAESSYTHIQNVESASQTVISAEPTETEKADEASVSQEASDNVLQINTEEAQYQSGDSLIFKNETNETNVGQTALTDITNISNATQTASAEFSNTQIQNAESRSQTVISSGPAEAEKADEASVSQEASDNVLQINTDEAHYQSGDSLIFKNENSQTDVEQISTTDILKKSDDSQTVVLQPTSLQNDISTVFPAESVVIAAQHPQNDTAEAAARELSADSTEQKPAARDRLNSALIDSASESAPREIPIQLALNAYLSNGAVYFSRLYRKNTGRTVALTSMLRQIFSGLQRNSETNSVFRAITLLNHPGQADESEQAILRYAEETVLTDRVYSSGSTDEFREHFLRLSDTQRTDLLRAVTLKLREQSGLTDGASSDTAITEDRLLRMLGVYGAPLIKEIEPASYPALQEFRHYYQHTKEERTKEEIEKLVRVIEKNSIFNKRQKTAYRDTPVLLNAEKAPASVYRYPGQQTQTARPAQADRDEKAPIGIPRSALHYFSLASKSGSELSAYGDYGYSGYPLHHVSALDTVVGRRRRALQAVQLISRGMTSIFPTGETPAAPTAYSDTAGGIALISERTLRDITDRSLIVHSDNAFHTENTVESEVVRRSDEPVDYSGVADSLSLHAPQISGQVSPQSPIPAASPSRPTTDELVSRFGNLIDGADYTGAGMQLSLKGDSGAFAKGLSELDKRLNLAENQTRANAEALKELQKKQKDTEKTVLKSTDMRQLSDEVINRLRQQLRLDRSRYGN